MLSDRSGKIVVLPSLLDAAAGEHVQLVFVRFTQLVQHVQRRFGFVLVDLAHRETHVDQHPIARADPIRTDEPHVDVAAHARDLYFGDIVAIVDEFENLTWYSKAHNDLLTPT